MNVNSSGVMLYVFGGLPGTGKSTLSTALARQVSAAYVRIDTIEQSLREAGVALDGPVGYLVGYALARENLRLGQSVVAESVNPLGVTRAAWRAVATEAGVAFIEIEVVCSNRDEHRARVETRPSTVPGLILPTWESVLSRQYEEWDTPHVVLDTARQSPDESIARLFEVLFAPLPPNNGGF